MLRDQFTSSMVLSTKQSETELFNKKLLQNFSFQIPTILNVSNFKAGRTMSGTLKTTKSLFA